MLWDFHCITYVIPFLSIFFLSILFSSVCFGFFHPQLVQFYPFMSVLACGSFWVLPYFISSVSVCFGAVLVQFGPVWVFHHFCPFCYQCFSPFNSVWVPFYSFNSVMVQFHPFLLFYCFSILTVFSSCSSSVCLFWFYFGPWSVFLFKHTGNEGMKSPYC